jgi:hypothetical protein
MHRFLWDVHYQPLPDMPGGGGGGGRGGLPIQAIPYNSAPGPGTPWVAPGTYTAKLTVDGKSYTQPIVVKQDPRVKTPAAAMQQVYTLTKQLYFGAVDAHTAATTLASMRADATKRRAAASGADAQALDDFIRKAEALQGTPAAPGGGRGGPAPPPQAPDTLWAARASLAGLMNSMQAADVAPTANTLTAVQRALANASRVMARYTALKAARASSDAAPRASRPAPGRR